MPAITHEGQDHFIAGISDGVTVGYKYFAFEGEITLAVTHRGQARGKLHILLNGVEEGVLDVAPTSAWRALSLPLHAKGTFSLHMKYQGEGDLSVRNSASLDHSHSTGYFCEYLCCITSIIASYLYLFLFFVIHIFSNMRRFPFYYSWLPAPIP